MDEKQLRHARESQGISPSVEVVDDFEDETARQEAELLERVRDLGRAVTAADHRAIYESSARDVAGFLERQGQQSAS